jgi:archaemetzincin
VHPSIKVFIGLLIVGQSFGQMPPDSVRLKLVSLETTLEPTTIKLPTPKAGDWLASNPESGQSFYNYVKGNPLDDGAKKKIYLLGFGDSSAVMDSLLKDSKEYLSIYYGVEVVLSTDWDLHVTGKCKRRKFGEIQIQTGCIMYGKLYRELPDDALVSMAITNKDLYPNSAFNYVFGEADIQNRVAVSSFARYGDTKDFSSYDLILKRLLKTVSHENGHGVGIEHCTAYSCNMNGSNSLKESDSQLLTLCPQCLGKTCWNTEYEPVTRYQLLKGFYEKHGYTSAAERCVLSLEYLAGYRVFE